MTSIFQKVAIFLICLLVGCGLFQKEEVTVTAHAPELRITNASSETLYYVVYPVHLMAIITIVPTCGEENAIKPGETKSIDYKIILQTGNDENAVVYWWRCDEGKKSTNIGNAHLIRVKL